MAQTVSQAGGIPTETELYARFAGRIRLFGLRHLRDSDAADDLVQEVVLTTLQKLRAGAVRELDRLPSFVLGTCRMMVRNQVRGRQRREALLETHADAARPSVSGPAVHPLDAQQLARCMAELEEKARAVLMLTFYAEQSSREVADELRTTPQNVRVMRHRTIQKLRTCMEARNHA